MLDRFFVVLIIILKFQLSAVLQCIYRTRAVALTRYHTSLYVQCCATTLLCGWLPSGMRTFDEGRPAFSNTGSNEGTISGLPELA
ncbi:hypothetical protein L226DRAFT_287639 [Lentinus tigrinus ALCF2SS1-7]|uniref:uncharacterized protein n=1 Tax=Lentinus tigrinus ALCF2SS1-7 TaxID=1328758 RepID=UPI001165E57E|nr:hypothetical protein L226DRAFT_287639 [Lentinus tigrinus ALCF2SS1-7]